MLVDVDMLFPHYNISKVNSDEILNHFEPSSSSIHSIVNDRVTSTQYNPSWQFSYNCPRGVANNIITTILQGPTYFLGTCSSAVEFIDVSFVASPTISGTFVTYL